MTYIVRCFEVKAQQILFVKEEVSVKIFTMLMKRWNDRELIDMNTTVETYRTTMETLRNVHSYALILYNS